MNKDTVVGVVGAVILLVAMVGVFKYEGSQAPSSLGANAYQIAWKDVDSKGPSVEDGTALGSSTSANLTVNQKNLTKVTFTLLWQAQNGDDTLRLTVTPPAGSGIAAPEPVEASSQGGAGAITLTVEVPNAKPEADSVFGNSEGDAKARLAQQNTKSVGTGAWGITVEFTAATGLLPPPAPPVGQDEQVGWTLETTLTSYEPVLSQSSR